MVTDGKAMAFVADDLHEMQHRRTAVENNRLSFASIDIDDLFAFCD
jgi:hypothetical protein